MLGDALRSTLKPLAPRAVSRRAPAQRSAASSPEREDEASVAEFKWLGESLEVFMDTAGLIGVRFISTSKCFSEHHDYLANVKDTTIRVSPPEATRGDWPSKCVVHVNDEKLLALANNQRSSSRLGNCLAVAWAIMKGDKGQKEWDENIVGFADELKKCCADTRPGKRSRDSDIVPREKTWRNPDVDTAERIEYEFPRASNGEQKEWGPCVGCATGEETIVLALGSYYKGKRYCAKCWHDFQGGQWK